MDEHLQSLIDRITLANGASSEVTRVISEIIEILNEKLYRLDR